MNVVDQLSATAIAAGFDPLMEETDLVELTCLILADEWLMKLVNENCRLEDMAPPPHVKPDEIMRATLESLSHGEKAALRNRVLAQRHWERVAEANEARARRRAPIRHL